MREKIIFAPGINTAELQRMLAQQGRKLFGYRFMGTQELAEYVLAAAGKALNHPILQENEELLYTAQAVEDTAQAVKGVPYFAFHSYSDTHNIASAIRQMRCMVVSDTPQQEDDEIRKALDKGPFKKKNEALKKIYQKYKDAVSNDGRMDSIDAIRQAVATGQAVTTQADVYVLEESMRSPLEEKLLNVAAGGKAKMRSLSKLLGNMAEADSYHVTNYWQCFDAACEVETVLEHLLEKGHLDECLAVVTDPALYAQLFFDEAMAHDIPMTFACGIPVRNSNPGVLLSEYLHWKTSGYYGKEALRSLVWCRGFDTQKLKAQLPEPGENFSKLIDLCGQLRLNGNETVNRKRVEDYSNSLTPEEKKNQEKTLSNLDKMAEILSLPADQLIKTFSRIRRPDGKRKTSQLLSALDTAAREDIASRLAILNKPQYFDANDVIRSILSMSTCCQSSQPGALHIASVEQGLFCIRKHMAVCGMNASLFPGRPVENYLLLDEDWENFADKKTAEPYTSAGRIRLKQERLKQLLQTAAALNSDVDISYFELDAAALKKVNPSSALYEIRTKNEVKAAKKVARYTDPNLTPAKGVGDEYARGKIVQPDQERSKTPLDVKGDLSETNYSPTQIETFFQCQRKFYLKYVLGIPEPDEEKPFEVIPANDFGTLAHAMMAQLDSHISKEEFISRAETAFDTYIKQHPPVAPYNIEREKKNFTDMLSDAYEHDPHNKVILKETEMSCTHKGSGIEIHGYPDRVEELSDGTYQIVDFKTGKKVKQKQDDVDSCLQVLLYGYIMEQKGHKISDGEYRYLRLSETISCTYDPKKESLDNKLTEFKAALEKGEFPVADGEEACDYCKYESICGKKDRVGGNQP
ncbi:MAG: PD-(D/E)XK nuclease family protein [Acidaminococcus sp.]|jgi:RecB family exonuclease|nr:PD-(D/E)XK nuclease family protein [Acidaminococcus sp.]MCI2100710.1 PD-(D/E)XK nuclease family protein [Acidaminococcus sp.]MCI2115031.1 PD-(D/E)XK nuclease family protein [Acidaminococcus sp.]MCI2117107.1 PD-(D/E)XK nuclease family protein [Acidaminococcus sp.]